MLVTTRRLLRPTPPPRIRTVPFPRRHSASTTTPPALSPEITPSPPPTSPRLSRLKHAAPFSHFLTDRFQRQHNYLRISITERCNLRCLYCMPAEGVPLSPAAHLLSTSEILTLSSLFVRQGVTKIRLTGGEPTVRKDVAELVESLGELRSQGLREIAMTTNAVALPSRKLRRMADSGLTGLNISLDTLVPAKFEFMTRRRGLERVRAVIDEALSIGFGDEGSGRTLKINVVVMNGTNEDEMVDFVELTRENNMEVRFIEYMPFDGNKWATRKMFPFADMLSTIRAVHPDFAELPRQRPNDTAKTYSVPGFAGKVGFITSMTENFCGSCNRLRITCDGNIKACLFGNEEVSLRDVMREYRSPDAGAGEGGEEMEKRLLEVIGGAVGRKEEGHKPAEELARGENRPMILIDNPPLSLHHHPSLSSLQERNMPAHLLPRSPLLHLLRTYSTKPLNNKLPHLTPTGTAHMVPIHLKPSTHRTATAVGEVLFSNPTAVKQIRENSNKKGDVLALARISGIMAAKKTPEIVVLCHPILVSSVEVGVDMVEVSPAVAAEGEEQGHPVPIDAEAGVISASSPLGEEGRKLVEENGRIAIRATVTCDGKTGVEMEALMAVMGAALAVVDMCKAVDRGIGISGVRVVEKRGGRSGDWVDGKKVV